MIAGCAHLVQSRFYATIHVLAISALFLLYFWAGLPCPKSVHPVQHRFFRPFLCDLAGSRVCGGRAPPRVVTHSRICHKWHPPAFICDTIHKSVTTGDESAAGSDLADIQGGPYPASVCRPLLSRQVDSGILARLLRVGKAGLADIGIFGGFLTIRRGLDTLHHAIHGTSEGKRGAQSIAIADRREQRNADARSRERRSMDAPPRRHRPRRAGYGGAGGCQRGAGARYARGGPRVYVKGGTGGKFARNGQNAI